MNDDSELIRRYVAYRSPEAFAELVRRHLNLVYATALRRSNGDAQLAEDITQETFTTLATSAHLLKPGSIVAGWLYLTARHATANAMRGVQRRQRRESEALAMDESLPSPAHSDEWAQLRPELETVLETLDGTERDAIVLRFFENEPFAEIGAALGVSADAARMRVDRALEKLRGKLAARGICSTTAALATDLMSHAAVVAPSHLAKSIMGSALVNSGAATLASASASFIMSAKTGVYIAAIMATIATSAVYEAIELNQAKASLAAADAALRASRNTAKVQGAVSSPSGALATAVGAGSAATATSLPAAPIASTPAAPSPFSFGYVLANPEMREPFLSQYALRLKAEYSRFFRAAAMTAEQQQWFLGESLELFKKRLDLAEALRTEAATASPEKTAALQMAASQTEQRWEAEFERALRERLGDSGYAEYQRANNTMLEQRLAEQLAGRLYWTESPLTSVQADQLVSLMREDRFNPRKSGDSSAPTIAGTVIDSATFARYQNYIRFQSGDARPALVTDAMLARAQASLAPAQVTALRDLQAQQLAQIRLAPKK